MPHESRPGIDLLLFDKEGGAAGWRRLGGRGKGFRYGWVHDQPVKKMITLLH